MMDDLIKTVSNLVGEEYQRATAQHGAAANTPHEGYAITKEEVEEAAEEMERLNKELDLLWANVRKDNEDMILQGFKDIKSVAIAGAGELIQVAAMAEKAIAGLKNQKGGKCDV